MYLVDSSFESFVSWRMWEVVEVGGYLVGLYLGVLSSKLDV